MDLPTQQQQSIMTRSASAKRIFRKILFIALCAWFACDSLIRFTKDLGHYDEVVVSPRSATTVAKPVSSVNEHEHSSDDRNSTSKAKDIITAVQESPPSTGASIPSLLSKLLHKKSPSTDVVNIRTDLEIHHHHLELNRNSTIEADIINITHVQNESKIIFHLKKQRKCLHPQLVGRLSGPVLSKIEWEQDLHKGDNDDFIFGHYHVPQPGQYYIEVIITMCVKLSNNTDVQPICLEDPVHHRLTDDDASVNVTSVRNSHLDQSIAKSIIGYWHNKFEKYDPLYTRYQPQHCRTPQERQQPLCLKLVDIARFDPYEFQFAEDFSLQKRLEGKEGKVCFDGASHARALTEQGEAILANQPFKNISKNVKVSFLEFKFARDCTPRHIQAIIDNDCTKVVVGTGQWDAGWPDKQPTSFPVYEKNLETAMSAMVDTLRKANVELFFRTTQ
eukprot:scaffold23973_cov58-Attheya_sp.AAC.7